MSMTSEDAAARLHPFITDYINTFNAAKFNDMARFYHKNSVMIETDKSVLWGPKDIEKSLEQMATESGKTEMQIHNSVYEGVGDFINLHTDFEFHTEKAGVLKGHYLQIWRKDGEVYTIYHDEYQLM